MLPEKLIPQKEQVKKCLQNLTWEERLQILEHLIEKAREKTRAEIYAIETQWLQRKNP